MKIVFPSNPNNGDLYPDLDAYDNPLDNGLIYEYNNGIWNVICSASEEDAIYDRGTWDIDLDPTTNGGITLYDSNGLETLSYEDVSSFTINEVDYYLTSHQYDVIEQNTYIQLFNREGYGYALYKVSSEAIDNGDNTFTIEVEFIQANPNDVLATELISVRYLNVTQVKTGIYYQSTAPTLAQYDLMAGDLWINNDAYGNQYHTTKVYDGISWDHINHVRKTGDTMTGTLEMSPDTSMSMLDLNPPPSGTIKIRANNGSGVTKTQLQIQGFSVQNSFEVSAGSNANEPILTIRSDKRFVIHNTTNYENADLTFQRFADANNVFSSKFSTIKSSAPIDAYGNMDSSDPFGIQFDLSALTTGKNRLRVTGPQNNPIVNIHGGVNPVIDLGTGFSGNNSGSLDVGGGVRVENVATPTELSPPHSAVNKEYVDTRDEFLQQEIIELEEEIEALAPSTERGMWKFELPPPNPTLGQVSLVLPDDFNTNTTYVFEITWDGTIDESYLDFEWKVMKGNTDVTSSVLTQYRTNEALNSPKVNAVFIEEGAYNVSCKVVAGVIEEEYETPQADGDILVEFDDGLPKIGSISIDPPDTHNEGGTEEYVASHSGDAPDDLEYIWDIKRDAAGSEIKVGVFDQELSLKKMELEAINQLGEGHPAISQLLRAYGDAMSRIENFIKYPDDVFWQHRWTQVNAEKYALHSNSNVQWSDFDGDQWKGLYPIEIGSRAGGASCARYGANDLVFVPEEATMAALAYTAYKLDISWEAIKNDGDKHGPDDVPWGDWFYNAWMNLLTHELLHSMHIIAINTQWYKFDGDAFDLWVDENYLDESLFPKTIATYRRLTGDDSYTMIPALGPLYGPHKGHPSQYPHTRNGKVYPGYESIIAIDENHYNRSDITIMEISMLVDQGWEELNPGASENDNPTLHWTSDAARRSLPPPNATPLSCSHHEPEELEANSSLRYQWPTDITKILNYPLSKLAEADSRYGTVLMDWSEPPITSTGTNADILIKKPGKYEITARATSTVASDSPKSKTIIQTVKSDTDISSTSFLSDDYSRILPPTDGKYYMLDVNSQPTSIFSDAKSIWLNYQDLNGFLHDFSDVKEEQLLEIFEQGDEDYGLYTIDDSRDELQGSTPFWTLDVTPIKSGSGHEADSIARFKIFDRPSSGDPDSFVLKIGDSMSGNLTMVKDPFNDGDVSPKIEFKSKNVNGTVYTSTLSMVNNDKLLECSSRLQIKDNLYCKSNVCITGNIIYRASNGNQNTKMVLDSTSSLNYDNSKPRLKWDSSGVTEIYFNSSKGSSGQVPTKTSSGIEWKTPSTGSSTTNYVRTDSTGFKNNLKITKSSGNYYITGG